MRYLVTWTAPYLHDSDDGESIGIYGIEGRLVTASIRCESSDLRSRTLDSKSGAPAAATFLHHNVVGLHKEGHGALLGEVSFACRRVSSVPSPTRDNH